MNIPILPRDYAEKNQILPEQSKDPILQQLKAKTTQKEKYSEEFRKRFGTTTTWTILTE